MKITIGYLKRIIREWVVDDPKDPDRIADIVHAAATAVKNDMAQSRIKSTDSIRRFDKAIESVIDPNVERPPYFWERVALAAKRLNMWNDDAWHKDGYGVVAAYAEDRTAYADLERKHFSSGKGL